MASSSFILGGAWYVKESSDTYDVKYSETDMFRTYVVFEVDGGSDFTLFTTKAMKSKLCTKP